MPLSWFIFGFIIYSYNFYNLGNTIYRLNEVGEYKFSLVPLFTVGIYGPIKTLLMLLYLLEFRIFINYFIFEITNNSNLFTVLIYLEILYLFYFNYLT